MVTKITNPDNLDAVLNYNEKKVRKGKAVCIHASGYLRDHAQMTYIQKKEGFERLNRRNERAKTKTLHISINFDPSEKLSKEKLIAIAEAYLKGIGFEGQPFLVYEHKDAGHPHIHIVTTTIREDGSRINTHNIGRNQSEKTRKQIEQDFRLVKASSKLKPQSQGNSFTIKPMEYGQTDTREYIEKVVNQVLEHYLVASIPELNAVLRKYNILADKGKEDSRVYKNNGLNYQMIDKKGATIGVPIKASVLKGKPGLKKLEVLFEKSKPAKEAFKKPLKEAIDIALRLQPKSLIELVEFLGKQNIDVLLRKSADGKVYGITFIDERNKTVINGSDLGKAYSAAHLDAKIKGIGKQKSTAPEGLVTPDNKQEEGILELLLKQEQEFNPGESQFKKKKRKRKNRNLGL